MARQVLAAVAVGALCGAAAGFAWGTPPGAGVGILVSIVGVTLAVLRRNRRDLEDLEHGITPEPVDRALGDDR